MTHDRRVYHHTYETNEGIAEHAERIASLEELVIDLLRELDMACMEIKAPDDGYTWPYYLEDEAKELGIEVKEWRCPMATDYTIPKDEYRALLSENAALRELVRDYDKMLEAAIVGYDKPDAPLLDAVHIALRSRMYESGIEVDEC